jgi:catechol 2,3-dioxygenase-like lactoylglutathione lyase family enzyme
MLKKYVGGVDHIAVQVSDLAEGLHFFNELLGFKVKFDFAYEDVHIYMLKAGKIDVELWAREHDGRTEGAVEPFRRYGVNHVAISVKNLDTVLTQIQQHGYKIAADIYEPTRGIREALIYGPDNLEVQLVEQHIPVLLWRAIKGDFKRSSEPERGGEQSSGFSS